jgi:hypothetical protein
MEPVESKKTMVKKIVMMKKGRRSLPHVLQLLPTPLNYVD